MVNGCTHDKRFCHPHTGSRRTCNVVLQFRALHLGKRVESVVGRDIVMNLVTQIT